MPRKALETQTQADLIALRSAGKTYAEIAHELGVSTSTVANYVKALKPRISEQKEAILSGVASKLASMENRIAQLEKQLNL